MPPEPPDVNWWMIALILLVVAVLAAAILFLGRMLWRRFRPAQSPEPALSSVNAVLQLERIGDLVGRPREPYEGVATYADALRYHTGDHRFATIGDDLSEELYQQAPIVSDGLRDTLADLETDPPEAPPEPPAEPRPTVRERGRRVASWGAGNRGLIFSVLAIVALFGFVGYGVITNEPGNIAAAQEYDWLVYEQPELVDQVEAELVTPDHQWTECYATIDDDDYWWSTDLAGRSTDSASQIDSRSAYAETGLGSEGSSYVQSGVGTAIEYQDGLWALYLDEQVDLAAEAAQPPLLGLGGLGETETGITETKDGTRTRTRHFDADWADELDTIPPVGGGAVGAEWSLVEWVDPDGEVQRIETAIHFDGFRSWRQVTLGDAEGHECPQNADAVVTRFDETRGQFSTPPI